MQGASKPLTSSVSHGLQSSLALKFSPFPSLLGEGDYLGSRESEDKNAIIGRLPEDEISYI